MRQKVKEWLEEDRYDLTEVNDDDLVWGFEANKDDFSFGVAVYKDAPKEITLTTKVEVVEYAAKFSELCYHKQRDLVYLLKLQLINHVSKFYIPEHRMDTIPIGASVKEKKLTEDSLLDAVGEIMKGAQIVLWMFEWKLGDVDLGVAS